MLQSNPNPAAETSPDGPRILPHAITIEQGLLGLLLIRNQSVEEIAEGLSEDHFYDPLHRQIYGEIVRAVRANRLANPVTLSRVFEDDPPISRAQSVPQYLGTLAVHACLPASAKAYAGEIVDLAKRRDLIAIGEDIVAAAYGSSVADTAEEQIERAEAALGHIAEQGSPAHVEISWARAASEAVHAANEAYRTQGAARGLSTGLLDLDNKLGGLQPSDLIILAGRPSMGKTALATNIAWAIAQQGLAVDFRSLEMSAEQLATRILAADIGVSGERLRRGSADEHAMHALVTADVRLRDTPLVIDQTGGLSIAQLSARARRTHRKHGTALIVVDYLQLMRGSGKGNREANRVQEISEITTGLKALAKELQVPILALSQLSRAVEHRTEKRPQLSDLRESGSIEQDADVVMFVFREEYYVERQEPDPGDGAKHAEWQQQMRRCAGKAEVIIGKQRHGPTGVVPLAFDGALTRFSNLAREAGR